MSRVAITGARMYTHIRERVKESSPDILLSGSTVLFSGLNCVAIGSMGQGELSAVSGDGIDELNSTLSKEVVSSKKIVPASHLLRSLFRL